MTCINEIFLGVHWSLESSEGFDEYLKAKGTPWIIRKAIGAAPYTITWNYLDTHKWLVHHKGIVWRKLFKSVKYLFNQHETCLIDRFDKHYDSIEINMGVDTVTERFTKMNDKERPEEVYTYYVENEKLVQEMARDGIKCTRTFKGWRPKNGMDHTIPVEWCKRYNRTPFKMTRFIHCSSR